MKKYSKYIFIFLAGFFVAATIAHYDANPKFDFDFPNQDVRTYTANNTKRIVDENFRSYFFKPWTAHANKDLSGIKEFLNTLGERDYYDGYGKKLTKEFYNKAKSNIDISDDNLEARKGIVIKQSNLRFLPDTTPFYYHPGHPTFGFPFDKIAYSSLYSNTPVLILATSKDKKFYLVSSLMDEVAWIDANDVIDISESNAEKFMNSDFAISTKEPIFSKDGNKFVIGTVFPLWNDKVFYATNNGWQEIISQHITKYPLAFSQKNIAEVAQFMKAPYAWGGINGEGRDCSQTLQDLFRVFGIHIPRNTKDQAETLEGIDISKLSDIEKKQAIVKNGIPFETILYLKGHAMLYIGIDKDNNPLVYHSIWGYKDYTIFLKETRKEIAKTVVTGLEDNKGILTDNLLERIEKILFIR